MEYNPYSIANYFLEKAAQSNEGLTPMKLLKLVYIAHGWHLGLSGKPLIEAKIEAWKYGPVIVPIYYHYKEFGNTIIPNAAVHPFGIKPDAETCAFLDAVWLAYSKYTGGQLSTLTHEKGTPWFVVWNDQGGCRQRGATIPDDLIKSHYEGKAAA